MKETKKINGRELIIALILTLVSFVAFQILLDVPEGIDNYSGLKLVLCNIVNSFKPFGIKTIILFVLLYLYYYYMIHQTGRIKLEVTVVVPAVLLAFFRVLGYPFLQHNSYEMITQENNGQIIKAWLQFFGCFFFFYFFIYYLFNNLGSTLNRIFTDTRFKRIFAIFQNEIFAPFKWYIHQLEKYPFRVSFITLFVFYIPYICFSYPAILMGDTVTQVVQAYSELQDTGLYYLTIENILSDQVFINQHHPVIHTLLIHFFLKVGEIFRSFNIGIFLYAMTQLLFVIAVISYAVKKLVLEIRIKGSYSVLVLLYYLIHPVVQNYMFLVTKDVFYSAFLLLELLFLYDLINSRVSTKSYVYLAGSTVGLILFRNDAKYILIGTFVILSVLLVKKRKVCISFLFFVVILSTFIFNILFPMLKFTEGSIREMMSVPFQQTARYVRDYPDEVTEEERKSINAVLEYDVLAEKYNPNLSDSVKGIYREDSTGEDMKRYLITWGRMFFKHPDVYFQATMNNYFLYFYPGQTMFQSYPYERSIYCMGKTNKKIKPLGYSFSYPEIMQPWQQRYESLRESVRKIPICNLIFVPATYTWMLIFLALYGIRKRNPHSIAILIMPCLILLICLFGPCNGNYGRYSYPLILCAPVLAVLYFEMLGKNNKNISR